MSLEGASNERSCSHRDLKVELQKSRNCMKSSSFRYIHLLASRMWPSITELDCSQVRGILGKFLDEKNTKFAFALIFFIRETIICMLLNRLSSAVV